MCRVLRVTPSGFRSWRRRPLSPRKTDKEIKDAGLTLEQWNKYGQEAVNKVKQLQEAEASQSEAWIIQAREKLRLFEAEGQAQKNAVAFAKERNKVKPPKAPSAREQQQYNFTLADWNKHQARALELAQKLREAEDSHNTIGAQQVRETAAKWYGKDKGKEGAFNFAQRVLADQQVAKNEADRAAREADREAARVDQALAAGRIDQARTALAELERIRERGLRAAKDDAVAHLKVEQESGEKIKQARINIAKKAYDADMLKAGSEKNAQLRSQMEAQARREYHAAVASAEDEYTKRLEDAGKAAVKQSKDTEAAIARIRQAQTQDTARQNLQVEQDALSKLRAGREQALREAGDNLTERERLTREWGAKEVQQLTRVAEAQLILAKRSGEAKLKSDLDSIEKSGGSAAEKKSLIDGANANFARSNAEAYRAYYAAIGEAATRSSNQVQDASKAA